MSFEVPCREFESEVESQKGKIVSEAPVDRNFRDRLTFFPLFSLLDCAASSFYKPTKRPTPTLETFEMSINDTEMAAYRAEFIRSAVEAGALKFGSFELKSGRRASPSSFRQGENS